MGVSLDATNIERIIRGVAIDNLRNTLLIDHGTTPCEVEARLKINQLTNRLLAAQWDTGGNKPVYPCVYDTEGKNFVLNYRE